MQLIATLLAAKKRYFRLALQGEAPFWYAWWLLGIPVVAAATWLGMAAEDFRYDEQHFTGALLDTAKLMLCLFWLIVAWRCSGNAQNRLWTQSGRIAIVLSIAFVGLIY